MLYHPQRTSSTHSFLKNHRFFYLALSLFALSGLIMAFAAELVWRQQPCSLCYYQRYGMFFLLITAFLAWIRFPRSFFKWVSFIALLICFSINTFHIGVEQKWWSSLESCVQKNTDLGSLNDLSRAEKLEVLRKHMYQAPLPRCDEVTWRIFTLPVTFWLEGSLLFMMILFLYFGWSSCKKSQQNF